MTAPGALHGMTVVDASQQLPGPYATLLLATLGAEVIKIEPVAGDPARALDPDMFDRVNRGKHSEFLDLKSPGGVARLHELVSTADVFVEGFRPGVTARLGCDEPTLRALQPMLVYCSLSGMGQTGPLASRPTHDLSLQAMVGALAAETRTDRIGVPWVDLATGTTAALAIVAAWHDRRGSYLDLSMLDAARSWASVKPDAVREPEPTYGIVPAADGQVVIALLEDSMWQRLCTALGWDDWANQQELARYADRQAAAGRIRHRLDDAFAQRTVAELLELATRHDLPIGAADASSDATVRAQLSARGRDGVTVTPLPGSLVRPLGDAPRLPE